MTLATYTKLVTQATQENEHTNAIKFIAMYVVEKHSRLSGVSKLIKNMDALLTLQEMYNCMTPELYVIRKDLQAQIFSFLNEEETKAFNQAL